jgi:EAL domain-containing protein (putative c-di-GMP-specific phosphodiesterase class I)
MTVTAEAVSETAQLDVLRELGCDRVQGFLLGTPMSLVELTVALRR